MLAAAGALAKRDWSSVGVHADECSWVQAIAATSALILMHVHAPRKADCTLSLGSLKDRMKRQQKQLHFTASDFTLRRSTKAFNKNSVIHLAALAACIARPFRATDNICVMGDSHKRVIYSSAASFGLVNIAGSERGGVASSVASEVWKQEQVRVVVIIRDRIHVASTALLL